MVSQFRNKCIQPLDEAALDWIHVQSSVNVHVLFHHVHAFHRRGAACLRKHIENEVGSLE